MSRRGAQIGRFSTAGTFVSTGVLSAFDFCQHASYACGVQKPVSGICKGCHVFIFKYIHIF
jgi:hypothetical protein